MKESWIPGAVEGVLEHSFLHGLKSALEQVGAGLFEPCPGDESVEVDSLDGQGGDVKGTTTEIEDEHVALCSSLLLVQVVGDGCISWLVDDPEHVVARDDASVLGCLMLGVVETGEDGDHGVQVLDEVLVLDEVIDEFLDGVLDEVLVRAVLGHSTVRWCERFW